MIKLLAIFIVVLFNNLAASNLYLQNDVNEYDLGEYLYYFVDTTNQLSYDDVLNNTDTIKFKKNENKTFNLAYNFAEKNVWIKFNLINNSKNDLWYIDSQGSLTPDLLQLHYTDKNGVNIFKSSLNPQGKHILNGDVKPSFKLFLGEGETLIFLKFNEGSSTPLPLQIKTEEKYRYDNNVSFFIHAMIIGVILGLLLYNISLSLSAGKVNNITYIITLTIFILQYLMYFGFGKIIFPNLHMLTIEKLKLCSMYAWFASYFAFSGSFLKLKSFNKKR